MRQDVMEQTVTSQLQMVAVGHAASRIQFAFLRHQLAQSNAEVAEHRRTSTSLTFAVKLAEQERDIERQTLSETLNRTEQAHKAARAQRAAQGACRVRTCTRVWRVSDR